MPFENQPSFWACSAFCCDASAKRSRSSRLNFSSVAMRSPLIPCGTWKTRLRRSWLLPSMPAPSEPIGTRDMLSTPPPMTRSCCPDITPSVAKLTPCRPDPQKRFSETPVTSIGQPAARIELRATQAPCSPAWVTQPTTTSSTSALSMPVRSASVLMVCANSSWGWIPESAPLPALPRPRGVRTASMMNASPMFALVPDVSVLDLCGWIA
jgi:hypothetical protein